MSRQPLVVTRCGMLSSVGGDAAGSCAAIRAGITNFTESRFMDRAGEWMMAAHVPVDADQPDRVRLGRFLALAIEECLTGLARKQWSRLPLLLCLAERERPGRTEGLDAELATELSRELKVQFHSDSTVVAQGRVSAAVALLRARALLYEGGHDQVLIAGADSNLRSATMRAYEDQDRLLTSVNTNGFVPGEGAAAVLVCKPQPQAQPQLRIVGLGFGRELATIDSDKPLRAEGLSTAIGAALADAAVDLGDLHYRIADLAGEQYYFREAALAQARLLRDRKEEFDLWHPADCVGETGAAAGLMCLCVAHCAAGKSYAPGPGVLLHFASDPGARACAVAMYC